MMGKPMILVSMQGVPPARLPPIKILERGQHVVGKGSVAMGFRCRGPSRDAAHTRQIHDAAPLLHEPI